MTGGFTAVINAVFGKLHRKAVKRTLVQAGNKSLYHLAGEKFKSANSVDFLYIERVTHKKKAVEKLPFPSSFMMPFVRPAWKPERLWAQHLHACQRFHHP